MEGLRLEPTSTGAAGFGLFKLLSLPVLASVASTVVIMLMTMPKKRAHQAVAIISTMLGSKYLGQFIIEWRGWNAFSDDAKFAVMLAAGMLPWVLIRSFFAYTERDKSKSIVDYIKEIRTAWKA